MSPLAALIIDWVLTAFWPILGQSGLALYSPAVYASAGFLIGFAGLLPWVLIGGRWRKIFALAPTLFWMGFFSSAATMIYISALDYTTPANAAIMAQVEVLYSALLCAYFLKEPVPRAQTMGSLLVMAGTGLVMAHDLNSSRWKGDLMMLCTPWMYQVSHIFSKRLPKDLEPVTISAGRIFYGLPFMLPFAAWSLAHGGKWSLSGEGVGILLAQGLGMSCLNFILWYRAIRGMDLAKATTIMLSYPALTVIFSWALGRETIHPVQIAGLIITLSGAYWVSMLVFLTPRP